MRPMDQKTRPTVPKMKPMLPKTNGLADIRADYQTTPEGKLYEMDKKVKLISIQMGPK